MSKLEQIREYVEEDPYAIPLIYMLLEDDSRVVKGLLCVAEAARMEPSFQELMRMGRQLKMWMANWQDIGDFRTGMEHLINQWRLRRIDAALAALDHLQELSDD